MENIETLEVLDETVAEETGTGTKKEKKASDWVQLDEDTLLLGDVVNKCNKNVDSFRLMQVYYPNEEVDADAIRTGIVTALTKATQAKSKSVTVPDELYAEAVSLGTMLKRGSLDVKEDMSG